MRFHKIIWHADGRSRDIYGAWGWGKTRINFLISIIAPGVGHNRRTFASCPDHAWLKRGESNKVAEPPTPSAINRAATTPYQHLRRKAGMSMPLPRLNYKA